VNPAPADEAPHAPAPTPRWSDTWQLDAATDDGAGLTVRLALQPNEKVAWFWTYLVLPTRSGPVVVRDHEVPLPRQGLEIRAEALWAELWCETPLEHWTYGLEAFAVALDDPADALTGEIGERVPIGLDLEWEVDGAIHALPDDWPTHAYFEPGIVHGEILLGRERLEFDARGEHQRRWGVVDFGATGSWTVGCAGSALSMRVEGLPDGRVDGYVERGNEPRRHIDRGRREGSSGAMRLLLDDDIEIEGEVLTGAPVPVDGHAVLDRSLCRLQTGDLFANGWSSLLEAR